MLRVSSGSHERFSGINTVFLDGVSLAKDQEEETTALGATRKGEQVELDNGGDIVVSFYDRLGSKRSGYICHYDWNLMAAQTVCKQLGFEAGLPTFNGRFTQVAAGSETVYAMSGVKCDYQSLDLKDCSFKTTRESPLGLVVQSKAVMAFGGKGYACGPKDKAGVLCGSVKEGEAMKRESVKALARSGGTRGGKG